MTANHARAEAALEIKRLESEAEQAAEALASSQRATQELLTRAARAEATSVAAQAYIQRLVHHDSRGLKEPSFLQSSAAHVTFCHPFSIYLKRNAEHSYHRRVVRHHQLARSRNMNFDRVILAAVAAVGLIGSVEAGTTPYCIAVNGGFGKGGTTFVARQFQVPVPNQCSPWAGYTKTSSTVVLNTSGSACLSEDGHVLTVGVSSVNPNWTGGAFAPDYIQICPTGVHCTSADLSVEDQPLAGNGIDLGFFGGSAEEIECTKSLLTLPISHA